MSAADDLADYRDWLLRRGRGRSVDAYSRAVSRYLSDPDDFEAQLTSGRYSPNYRRFLAASVKSWARFSRDEDLIERLGDIRLPAPVAKEHREPFDMETWIEIRQEIAEAPYLQPGVRAVCSIVAVRGIRCGDILRVTRAEVVKALKTGILAYEGKGERRQKYSAAPMKPYLEDLEELFEGYEWRGKDLLVRHLVCKSGAQDTAGKAVRRGFDRVADHLEVDRAEIHAHKFRHTYATHFLQAMEGDPEAIFKLQTQMGWARLETAGNYLRRSRRDELDDIESRLLGLSP
jgi:integrase